MEFAHKSVLLSESVEFLVTDPAGVYLDCTMGGAGHALAIADRLIPTGHLIAIDRDSDAIKAGKERLANAKCKVDIRQANFKDFPLVLQELAVEQVTGIFFDLGVSSYQLDTASRGFSYMQDGPLDMRMDMGQRLDASYVVNTYSEEKLAAVIMRYGEERWAQRIAKFIVAARREKPLATTGELVAVIKKAIPLGARKDGPHPAKRTFQALRIEVNGELSILEDTIRQAIALLAPKGRIGVITFHSLEDRIVKQCFAEASRGCICPPNLPVCVCGHSPQLSDRRAIVPSKEEIISNPRARSARLRCAVKV